MSILHDTAISTFYASHFNGPKHLFRFVPPCSFFAILSKKSHRMMNNNALEFWQIFLETILVFFPRLSGIENCGPTSPEMNESRASERGTRPEITRISRNLNPSSDSRVSNGKLGLHSRENGLLRVGGISKS